MLLGYNELIKSDFVQLYLGLSAGDTDESVSGNLDNVLRNMMS